MLRSGGKLLKRIGVKAVPVIAVTSGVLDATGAYAEGRSRGGGAVESGTAAVGNVVTGGYFWEAIDAADAAAQYAHDKTWETLKPTHDSRLKELGIDDPLAPR